MDNVLFNSHSCFLYELHINKSTQFPIIVKRNRNSLVPASLIQNWCCAFTEKREEIYSKVYFLTLLLRSFCGRNHQNGPRFGLIIIMEHNLLVYHM